MASSGAASDAFNGGDRRSAYGYRSLLCVSLMLVMGTIVSLVDSRWVKTSVPSAARVALDPFDVRQRLAAEPVCTARSAVRWVHTQCTYRRIVRSALRCREALAGVIEAGCLPVRKAPSIGRRHGPSAMRRERSSVELGGRAAGLLCGGRLRARPTWTQVPRSPDAKVAIARRPADSRAGLPLATPR